MASSDEIRDRKKELRRIYKAKGKALTDAYREKADRAIRDAVLRAEAWRRAEAVFVYVSMWHEPDTRKLIEAALSVGKRVYVPLCLPDHTMRAVHIRGLGELRPGVLGIPEPSENAEAALPGELDLAVVPCVTATGAGARLGHGAGYYDRFLRLHRCPAMCLCYGALLADELPMEEHDVRMDIVVTENNG